MESKAKLNQTETRRASLFAALDAVQAMRDMAVRKNEERLNPSGFVKSTSESPLQGSSEAAKDTDDELAKDGNKDMQVFVRLRPPDDDETVPISACCC